MAGTKIIPAAETTLRRGLSVERFFSTAGRDPLSEVQWERRNASIQNQQGQTIFAQANVEVPQGWSQTATNIVASKYFHGKQGSPEREASVRQLISRVADTITRWGYESGYFRAAEDVSAFHDDLVHLLLHQKAAFNSPVWFNCGLSEVHGRKLHGTGWHWDAESGTVRSETEAHRRPQCSACFINSVEDNLDSILTLAKTEGMLFKWGSGTGTNLSSIRSSMETLSGGGVASGPLSFMRGYDAFAGVIKSGGKTRRAAKMAILNADHPDIEEFIECKAKEERKAAALIEAGYDAALDGEAYSSIFFQNANNSVRVSDEFMTAVEEDGAWVTKEVTTGRTVTTYRARGLVEKIARAAWQCGDPGMQFDSVINLWNPCKASGRINASNPCSEYMFLDDSACNLASLNLLKFAGEGGQFDVAAFRHAVNIVLTAQEILVDNASYPTQKIARNSHDFRPLGLGYANLGALLMSNGLSYDSQKGRDYAATITALMHGQAGLTSSRLAAAVGPFPAYAVNEQSFQDVMRMHEAELSKVSRENVPAPLWEATECVWAECLEGGLTNGYRNAQLTVLAPTGTIGFMMDCDTTGIEPELALVKYKRLVGGGFIKIVNRAVPLALSRLGYADGEVLEVVSYIDREGTIEGAPHLKPEHLPVFDCSLKPSGGKRSIHYRGHLLMMSAVQPFLSGAISKTVNLPRETTPERMTEIYIEAWQLKLKAIAIYRDGSKRSQPLSTAKCGDSREVSTLGTMAGASATQNAPRQPMRRRMPDERQGLVHHFSVGGHEGYVVVGLYEDGRPGEMFIRMAKAGSSINGLMDSFGIAVSLALQYGVPLKALCEKFSHTRFEPSGWSGVKEIGYAKSLMDYLFRWLALKFLPPIPPPVTGVATEVTAAAPAHPSFEAGVEGDDAPACQECGEIMSRNGSCYRCGNCGCTSGCS
ncbi:MAG: vitamin B12-dependent ribonucleotide reductase [Candidatus Acidiferrales bacterium]